MFFCENATVGRAVEDKRLTLFFVTKIYESVTNSIIQKVTTKKKIQENFSLDQHIHRQSFEKDLFIATSYSFIVTTVQHNHSVFLKTEGT